MLGQIKASTSSSNFLSDGTAVKDFKVEHLEAWKQSSLPVTLFFVDLRSIENPLIYWFPINESLQISNPKDQRIKFTKILNKDIWNEFDQILRENKEKLQTIEDIGDKNIFHQIKEKEISEQLRLLPEFSELQGLKEKWLLLREKRMFKEFNPHSWRDEMLSSKPKVGRIAYIPKAVFSDSSSFSYQDTDIISSDRAVEDVFQAEEAKLILDLLNYHNNQKEKIELSLFAELENIIDIFTDPILLVSYKNRGRDDFRKLEPQKIDSNENDYQSFLVNIGNQKLPAVEFKNLNYWKKFSEKLPHIKAILFDKKHSIYQEKIPLELEWRTTTNPITIRQFNDKDEEVEETEDPHMLEVSIFTVTELIYNGPIAILWETEEELHPILKKKLKR